MCGHEGWDTSPSFSPGTRRALCRFEFEGFHRLGVRHVPARSRRKPRGLEKAPGWELRLGNQTAGNGSARYRITRR
ncbi:hypothetical protein ABH15_08940 [Methanoculleus taiwanensis]|uniref:Uncharacterized protein n=1 Tax=Methanoculleus taiwanensis TaxID=1550565 RepID=A0A498H2U5_9EURY|nr:hypothetical protein ABH15_08940 [Methanoculleus taiwanensis]